MPRRFLILLLCAVLAFPVPFAWGQATDFETALSGAQYPLTLKIKDLDGSWRRVSLGTSSGAVDPNPYYTKGDTDQVAGETFLVAYHRQTQMDLQTLMSQMKAELQALSQSGDDVPKAPKVTPKTSKLTADPPLSLCLLNVRTLSSLSDIQPFLPNQKAANLLSPHLAARDGVVGDPDQTSVSNLKHLGLGMTQYFQAESGDSALVLPPMESAAAAKQALHPYVKAGAIFQQPRTHAPYQPNKSLSHRALASFANPATAVTYYEASFNPDGRRAVLFLDGHVRRVDAAEWQRLKIASHVPNLPSAHWIAPEPNAAK